MALELGKAVTLESRRSYLHTLHVETASRVEFKDVTAAIQQLVADSGVPSGVCYVLTPHTSAAVLVQENDDASVQKDLGDFLGALVPRDKNYLHNDGNCDAHLKASLIGCSQTLLIENSRLLLGRWQGVFLCEFDGPRRRDLHVKIVAD
ncbi:MAG TPA: secondary thiamine-phosphate synthase enzyme YjbQ [Terriglobia bacterium]|jgi:secondary thiamine-phosphate synthase enzyme|nr:secondary thiamine-phosphate synthase enzyme YjbQ [Terriglobia bacterium]